MAWRQDWVDNNIYSTAADSMFIVRANGAVRYAWFGEEIATQSESIQSAAVRAVVAIPGLRDLAAAATASETVTHTMTSANGALTIVAVAPFSLEDESARVAGSASNHDYMVIVDVLSPDELAEMGAAIDLQELAFTALRSKVDDEIVTQRLAAAEGQTIGMLSWRHARRAPLRFKRVFGQSCLAWR